MSFRKCPSKTEYTKISAKSFRFDSSNHFENELISDMSEQGSLDIWLETKCLKKSIGNHQAIFAKITKYLIPHLCSVYFLLIWL